MERRNFLKLIVAGTIGTAIKPEVLGEFPLWNPHPAQLKFLNSPIPPALYGMPYHQSNASMAYKELVKLVSLLEENKKSDL